MSSADELPVLTVTNRVSEADRSQDEIFEFPVGGPRRTFGRDDNCDIVIWAAHAGESLARVAGEIWRMDDELWVRNLTPHHALTVMVPDEQEQILLLPTREGVRGRACGIPAPLAVVTGPGNCLLEVQQLNHPRPETFSYGLQNPTLQQVQPVPERFLDVATALCEPLLHGDRLPATYSQVLIRLGRSSLTTLRKEVAELCEVYTGSAPELARRVALRKEAADDPVTMVKDGLIQKAVPNPSSRPRERRLTLPDYYEVAQLLVSFKRITVADLDRLPPTRSEMP